MISAERRLYILDKVNQEGKVTITQLVEELDVSTETIRRDIAALAKEAKVKKVHGGAVKVKKSLFGHKYNQRANMNHDKKVICGKIAEGYIENNDIIAIDSGTTAVQVVEAIEHKHNLTFITNSVKALNVILEKIEEGKASGKVIFLGGDVDTQHYNTEGFMVEKQLEHIYIDKLFFGATSLSESGIMAYDPNEGRISSIYLKHANQCFLVIDSSKVGNNSVYKIGDIHEVDYIITDDLTKFGKKLVAQCIEHNVQLIDRYVSCE